MNGTKDSPKPMTSLEYARHYADACVKADVVSAPRGYVDVDEDVDAGADTHADEAGLPSSTAK